VSDILFDEVVTAYYDCRRNKRNSKQQIKFEFNLEENLWNLYEDLKNETYTPGSHIYFILTTPKPREVWASNFRDRVVHHVLYNRLSYIEDSYVPGSYACLKNKGTLRCAKDFQKCLRNLWSEKENYRVLQVDISNFYVSLDKNILKEKIFKITDNETTLRLLNLFINQNPTHKYHYKGNPELRKLIPERKSLFNKDTGLPIGNLTSQMFANFYLNELDHFAIKNITSYYFRYLDDMIFVLPKEVPITQTINLINEKLSKLGLQLNPCKTKHNVIDCGVNFVGFIVKPFSLYIRNSTKHRAKRAKTPESINSYYGLMRQGNCYNLRKSIAIKNNLTMFNYQKLI
jgi:hypothetical protein